MSSLALDVGVQLGTFRLEVDERVPLDGVTVVFGASGSGKTSLLRVIAGLERNARGTVRFDDLLWQNERTYVPAHLRSVGYVFQDGRLFPHLTVRDNLRFARRTAAARFDDVVGALDLEPLLPRRPASLSGGEQQRVAIGRALLAGPRLMLMDEPLSSLDLSRKREILRYIEQLRETFGLPTLYVTHDIDEVVRLADHLILLAEGRVAAQGSAKELLDRIDLWPLIGRADAGSLIEARVREHRNGMTVLGIGNEALRIPEIEAAEGRVVRLRVHARDVVLATEQPRNLSIRNVLTGQVAGIDLDRSVYAELLLAVGDQSLRARITKDALEELRIEVGQQVFALVKTVAFDAGEYSLLSVEQMRQK